MKIMEELRMNYDRQLKEYDSLVQSADPSQIPKLKELNASIAKTLNEMIQQLTYLKKETPSLKEERDELIERLRQIQRDYNGLLVNTDSLETLRRIRQQEGTEANRLMYMYLFFFLSVCLAVFFYMLFATHRNDTTVTSASMPPMTAALV
jgi:vacuolar-type H+-ATPase subunit D/Vma8